MQQKGLDLGAGPQRPATARRALTVAELTDRIQGALEVEFSDVWVEGEISNLKFADSGHCTSRSRTSVRRSAPSFGRPRPEASDSGRRTA
jgi:hypothetical protein